MENKSRFHRTIYVLDQGFIKGIDFMGDDHAIAEAARVSYQANNKPADQDRDKKLIRYLISHSHTSPLEMCEFKFHCRMPLFCARQLIRHRTFSVNEVSGRYSELDSEYYIPDLEQIKSQSKSNKQGREEDLVDCVRDGFQSDTEETGKKLFEQYKRHLEEGVSRELARINLPLSTYTEWYWKADLNNIFHMLKLRMDSHAQWECQEYARAIYELIKPIVPVSCEAFEDYVLNAKTFSAQEMKILMESWDSIINSLQNEEERGLSSRELQEFKDKLGL